MNNKLNIIYLGFYSYPCGSAGAKRVQYQVEFLQKSNVDVKILIPKKGKSGVFNNVPYFYGRIKAFIKICKFKKKGKSNIIIIGTLIEAKELFYVLFAKIMRYKVIMDKVEFYKFYEEKLTLKHKINIKIGLFCEKFLKWFSDGFLVISTLLYSAYSKLNKPMIIMPNSVPVSSIILNKKTKYNKIIKIIYAGTFGMKDGVEYLIKAFKKISCEYSNIELHLLGKGTIDNNNRIKTEIGKHKNLIFQHGFVKEAEFQQILLDGDILAVTRTNSLYANYGFPYKLTEYLCTGNPVLATDVGDIKLYLEDKTNVILAKADDVDSIYNAIKFCMKNENEVIGIGKKGQSVIEQKFSIEKNGVLLLDFLLKF